MILRFRTVVKVDTVAGISVPRRILYERMVMI